MTIDSVGNELPLSLNPRSRFAFNGDCSALDTTRDVGLCLESSWEASAGRLPETLRGDWATGRSLAVGGMGANVRAASSALGGESDGIRSEVATDSGSGSCVDSGKNCGGVAISSTRRLGESGIAGPGA